MIGRRWLGSLIFESRMHVAPWSCLKIDMIPSTGTSHLDCDATNPKVKVFLNENSKHHGVAVGE
jgi:hypothetical protein